MGKILHRIAQIAEKEGISIGALERSIGASKGVLSRAISRDTDIQTKWIEAIVENYPTISSEWLLRGKGNMISDTIPIDSGIKGKDPIKPEDTIYKKMLEEKDKEIAKLNREIGRLQHAVEHLKKGGTVAGFGVEVRTKLDE